MCKFWLMLVENTFLCFFLAVGFHTEMLHFTHPTLFISVGLPFIFLLLPNLSAGLLTMMTMITLNINNFVTETRILCCCYAYAILCCVMLCFVLLRKIYNGPSGYGVRFKGCLTCNIAVPIRLNEPALFIHVCQTAYIEPQ